MLEQGLIFPSAPRRVDRKILVDIGVNENLSPYEARKKVDFSDPVSDGFCRMTYRRQGESMGSTSGESTVVETRLKLLEKLVQGQAEQIQDHKTTLQQAIEQIQDHKTALQQAIEQIQDHKTTLQQAIEQIQDHEITMQWQGEQIQDREITMQRQGEQIQDHEITMQWQGEQIQDHKTALQQAIEQIQDLTYSVDILKGTSPLLAAHDTIRVMLERLDNITRDTLRRWASTYPIVDGYLMTNNGKSVKFAYACVQDFAEGVAVTAEERAEVTALLQGIHQQAKVALHRKGGVAISKRVRDFQSIFTEQRNDAGHPASVPEQGTILQILEQLDFMLSHHLLPPPYDGELRGLLKAAIATRKVEVMKRITVGLVGKRGW